MKTIIRLMHMGIFLCLMYILCSCQQAPASPLPGIVLPMETPPSNTSILPGFTALYPVSKTPLLGQTQIEFLIDNSGSVIGKGENKGCKGADSSTRMDFISYVRNIITSSLISQNEENLSLKLATFGDKYTPLDFNSLNSTMPLEGHTNYAMGIQAAIQDMYASEASDRYLVLITDGALTSESIYSIQAELQNQIKNQDHQDLSIYIGLLCPEEASLVGDIQIWNTQISTLDRVEVLSGLEEVAKKIFDKLETIGFLPSGSKSIVLPIENQEIEMPGYARSVIFSYWNADGNNILYINSTANGEQASLIAGTNHTFQQVPSGVDCSDINYTINNSKSSRGLLFIKPKLFDDLQISMDSLVDGKIEIINYQPVKQEITIVDGKVGDIGKWNYCFNANFIAQREILNISDPAACNNSSRNLCFVDDKLFGDFTLDSLKIRDNSLTEGKIVLSVVEDIPKYVWESQTLNFKIKFQAETKSTTSEKSGNMLMSYFLFDNILISSPPDVYLLSDLNREQIEAPGIKDPSTLCPSATLVVNNQLASRITNFSCSDAIDDGVIASICLVDSKSKPYTLMTYGYSVEKCGYKNVLFDWPDSENVKAVTWKCNILGTASCEETPYPSIIPIPE